MAEATSTDSFTANGTQLTPTTTVDATTVSTSTEGRLLVSKTLGSLQVNCSGTARAWLELDGVRVPGTVLGSLPSGESFRAVTLMGVTTEPVPAGAHVVRVAVWCSTTGSSVTTFGSDNATVVVLGG